MLSYVDDCVYWYTYEELGNWFLDTLGKRFHVNFLGYAHFFMSILISQLKDHYISVVQASYATYVVKTYLDASTIKEISNIHNTILYNDIIFIKEDASTGDEQVKEFSREYNIH